MSKTRFWSTIILAAFLGVFGFIFGGIFPLPSPYSSIQSKVLYTFFGVLTGLLTYAQIATWAVKTTTKVLRYLVITIASEVAEQVGKVSFHKGEVTLDTTTQEAIILDTSSIIDGRILDVAKTGFLYGNLIIPEFVLDELQQVADSADDLKRARGRRGFEIINNLKKLKRINLQIWDKNKFAVLGKDILGKKVDEKIISLGKALGVKVLTADFNLGSVAKIRGVEVLNLNELANALKTLPVPGEKIKVKLVHLGKDRDQGVGYLSDGAMVVVKDGAPLVGQEAEAEVTKILQGSSGRMVFGKLSTSATS